jgi:hypothetical protein
MEYNLQHKLCFAQLTPLDLRQQPTFITNKYKQKTVSMISTRKGSIDSIEIKPKFKT